MSHLVEAGSSVLELRTRNRKTRLLLPTTAFLLHLFRLIYGDNNSDLSFNMSAVMWAVIWQTSVSTHAAVDPHLACDKRCLHRSRSYKEPSIRSVDRGVAVFSQAISILIKQ